MVLVFSVSAGFDSSTNPAYFIEGTRLTVLGKITTIMDLKKLRHNS